MCKLLYTNNKKWRVIMNIQAYLNRFRAELKEERDLLYLTHLQGQHLLHVPYENLQTYFDIKSSSL